MTRASREHPAPEVGHTSYHAVFAIAESPRSKDVLWTGSDDGLVWVTRDGGKTWAEVSASFPKGAPTSCWVATIAASSHVANRAYVAYDCHHRDDYGPHVYRTEDLGKTWVEIGQGLPQDGGSLTVFEDPVNQRLLWVGTASGVYVTLDGGRSWRRFGKNLPNVPVECLAISFAQRDLVVATHGTDTPVFGRPRLSVSPARYLPRLGEPAVRRVQPATRRGDRVLLKGGAAGRRQARHHDRRRGYDPPPHGSGLSRSAARHVGLDA